MSGHSHFATIKRQKEAKDSQRGKVFSRHAKAIQIAIKSGGGANPEMNSKLRFAIEQAKGDNVPKSNIDRILSKASELGDIEEVNYEGYGPYGIAVIVEVATDNKNRTGQEIKNIFERGGGSLAGPGAVSFNFETKGLILVEKQPDLQKQMLELIDMGVEDVREEKDGLEVYVDVNNIAKIKQTIEGSNKILSSSILKIPKTPLTLESDDKVRKAINFLSSIEEQEDVQDVYSNLDIPDNVTV